MAAKTLSRLKHPHLLGGALMLLLVLGLLVTLHLMSNAVQSHTELSRIYVPLLIISLTGLVILLVLIAVNLIKMAHAVRADQPGARLTARMVVFFVVLALIPVLVVYYYSLQFLQRGIDSWFDVEIDTAMRDALELGQASLNLEKRRLLHQTKNIARKLTGMEVRSLLRSLSEQRELSGATELTVLGDTGIVIASQNIDPGILVADTPDISILQQVRGGNSFVGITPYGRDNLLHLRVVVRDSTAGKIVQALYPTTERISLLSENVQRAYESYQRLSFLRDQLRVGFKVTLVLVLFFSIFTAVWAAIVVARRLLAPVVDLAEATRSVAEGDYTTRLPELKHRDELSFLVTSFNEMTHGISLSRDAAANSQRQVEAQRSYLQTILEQLSTGVIAFSSDGYLRTANSAASRILQVDLDSSLGQHLSELARTHPLFESFVKDVLAGSFKRETQTRIETSKGARTLRWHKTRLSSNGAGSASSILMFDDITNLLQAQRDAAWAEVARRLAHEIKNPLTPIRLSAERLRRKYLPKLEVEGDVLNRATHTIIQQVDAMKEMVNAFSDYARLSVTDSTPQEIEFDALLREVVALYQEPHTGTVDTLYGAGQVRFQCDPIKIRQLIHNLLINAQESIQSIGTQGRIEIKSGIKHDGGVTMLTLNVCDNGPGFDLELKDRLFDPYVTTKEGGTGLGLAIVKKIIEDHEGEIRLSNRKPHGACFEVRFPVEQSSV